MDMLIWGDAMGLTMTTTPNAGIALSEVPRAYRQKARVRTLNKIATVLSGELENVGTPVKKVIVDPRGRACTDGETVWIPMKVHDDEVVNRIAQEAILAHEAAGHLRYTDFQAWKKIGDQIRRGHEDRLLHDFTNILEDARVNHLLSQDFAGSGKRLLATQAIFMDRHKKNWATKTVDEINPRHASMIAMMTEAIAHQPHFFDHVPEVVAYMDEVRPICATAIGQPNTGAVIRQAKRMLAIYRKHFPEDAHEDSDTFGMPNGEDAEGVMTDDMSPEEIEKMAEKQRQKDAKPEEANRQRFQDLKKKIEKLAEEAQKKAQEAQEEAQGGDTPSDDEEGSGEASNGQESGESDESTEGDGDGCDGEGEEGDSDGGESGAGDSDSDCDSDGGEGDGGEGEGEGESTDGDSSESSWEFNEGEGSDENGEGESDEMGAGGDRGMSTNDIDLDEMWAEVQEAMDAEEQDARDLKHDFDNDCDDTKDPMDPIDEFYPTQFDDGGHVCIVSHMTDEFIERGNIDIDANAEAFNAVVGENKTAITTMVNEMKRLLKGANNKHERGLKRGMLDSRKLAYHRTNERLFMKKNEPKKAEANVIILIDSSGSMGGRRAEKAAQTACVFAEVMNKLGFGCEIVDFASHGNTTAMRIRKQMNAPLNNITKAAIRTPTAGGNNADGYAVEWCLMRLQSMKGNRMLFVISDGQPAGPSPPNMGTDEHLRTVVANAPKDIGLFSVGIDGMDTSRYYDNAVCVADSNDLVRQSMPVIRKMVRTVKNKA